MAIIALIFFCFLFFHQGKKKKSGFGGKAPVFLSPQTIYPTDEMKRKRQSPLGSGFILTCALLLPLLPARPASAQRPAEPPAPIRHFIERPILRGASVSFVVKRVTDGKTLYNYEGDRQLTPASVMKTVTSATALELLGEDFRFETTIEYDGELRADGVLDGNLYIRGGGDPTLNSSESRTPKDSIVNAWVEAVRAAGIREITGSVVADERVFDTEGVSMKWLREDLGSSYGQGSYGLNIFDNRIALSLSTGAPGTTPRVTSVTPRVDGLTFHNYLRSATKDSAYVVGFPYASERALYGTLPARRSGLYLGADLPDPPLFVARYVSDRLREQGIRIRGRASSYRIQYGAGRWSDAPRHTIVTTYSRPLREIVRALCVVSHNLYADALLKTLGRRLSEGEQSSFGRGAQVVRSYWEERGLDADALWMYDGSGLAVTDKVTASFLCDMLTYMATQSRVSEAFYQALPLVGREGTVRRMLRDTDLDGRARLKGGSMSRVLCYAGYVDDEDGVRYAVAVMANNYTGRVLQMRQAIEELLVEAFE